MRHFAGPPNAPFCGAPVSIPDGREARRAEARRSTQSRIGMACRGGRASAPSTQHPAPSTQHPAPSTQHSTQDSGLNGALVHRHFTAPGVDLSGAPVYDSPVTREYGSSLARSQSTCQHFPQSTLALLIEEPLSRTHVSVSNDGHWFFRRETRGPTGPRLHHVNRRESTTSGNVSERQ